MMSKRKVIGRCSIIGIFLYFVVSILILYNKMQENNIRTIETIMDKTAEDNGILSIEMVEGEQSWRHPNLALFGAQYDFSFTNYSKYEIVDWCVEFQVPGRSYIDSSWNGVFELTNETLRIRPVDFNQDVRSDENLGFGMILYIPMGATIDYHATVTVNMAANLYYQPLFWINIVVFVVLVLIFLYNLGYRLRLRKYKKEQKKNKKIILQSLVTLAYAIDAKDVYLKGHSFRVAGYSREMVRRMGGNEQEQEHIYNVALLHDIGKIGIPDSILCKPGALTEEERYRIQQHTAIGGDILRQFTSIEGIGDGARYHHEKYDGTGYPEHLKGEEIPICARIICIADSYDAMASERCYRKALDKDYILSELERCSGSQFDPKLVCHMIDMLKEGFEVPNSDFFE